MTRNNNFTIIHILSALLVMLGHQFDIMGQTAPLIFGMPLHTLGVRILFLVSGYLVSMSYCRSTFRRNFLWKRAIKIYPALIVSLIVTVIALRFLTGMDAGIYWNAAARYVIHNVQMRPKFDVADVFYNNTYPITVNGSLWTLPIELACYLLVIPVIDVFRRLNKKKYLGAIFYVCILLLLSVFECFYQMYWPQRTAIFWDTDWYKALSLAIWFFIGSGFYAMDLKRYCNWQWAVVSLLVLMCTNGIVKVFLTPFLVSYAVICFALPEKPVFARALEGQEVGYGLYLYGMPVQQLFLQLFFVRAQMEMPVYVYALISIAFTWIIAKISLTMVEEPIARRLKSPPISLS